MNFQLLIENHELQNGIYLNEKAGISTTDPKNKKWLEIANIRLDGLTRSLSDFKIDDLDASSNYVETVDNLVSLFDDVVLECVLLTKRRDEVEEKILNIAKDTISKPTSEDKRDQKEEHIVSKLIDGLLMSEVPIVLRSTKMVAALLDDTNPLRLGLTYYRKFCRRYPDAADSQALEYLDTEEETRLLLQSGQREKAVEAIQELFDSSVKSPEKYLLMALNAFHSGLESDAIRTLEIGLEAFPGNIRLTSAKGLLQDS